MEKDRLYKFVSMEGRAGRERGGGECKKRQRRMEKQSLREGEVNGERQRSTAGEGREGRRGLVKRRGPWEQDAGVGWDAVGSDGRRLLAMGPQSPTVRHHTGIPLSAPCA